MGTEESVHIPCRHKTDLITVYRAGCLTNYMIMFLFRDRESCIIRQFYRLKFVKEVDADLAPRVGGLHSNPVVGEEFSGKQQEFFDAGGPLVKYQRRMRTIMLASLSISSKKGCARAWKIVLTTLSIKENPRGEKK